MTAARLPDAVDREVQIRLGVSRSTMQVVRVLVAAVATEADVGFDRIADLQLAVDEVVSALVLRAADSAVPLTVHFSWSDGAFVASVENIAAPRDLYVEGDFGWHVLTALTDEVAIIHEPGTTGSGSVSGIALTVNRLSA